VARSLAAAARLDAVAAAKRVHRELDLQQRVTDGAGLVDVFEAIECRPVAAIGSLRNGVPQEVDRLILGMLDRRPDARPSAREVCDVLGKNTLTG